jgi:diguanylate cyclase (GGDEF)-like protein/PAS domain S-box-containing protein
LRGIPTLPDVRTRAWLIYLASGAIALALFAGVPPFEGSGTLLGLVNVSAVAAVVVGIFWHRPQAPLPWWCFAIGLGLFWAGESVFSDAVYLAGYPFLMVGLLALVRQRNRLRGSDGSGIDATILTLGLALPAWLILIAPYLHQHGAEVDSIAHPIGDILLLAAAVRLALDSGARRTSFHLLIAAILTLLVTDFAYGQMLLAGTYAQQTAIHIGWAAGYLLWGACALHPSMRDVNEPTMDMETRLTAPRLALLAVATLIAPVVELANGPSDTEVVTICASVVLFFFVIARMAGLIRQHERSVARQRILSRAGAELVAARGADEIVSSALGAMRTLLHGEGEAILCRRDERGLRPVARTDGEPVDPDAELSAAACTTLLDLAAVPEGASGMALDPTVQAELGLAPESRYAVVFGLRIGGHIRGMVLVARPALIARPVTAALRSLATQLALALEGAELTEEVHRRRSESRFAALVAHSSDLITVLGSDATIEYQSPSSLRVLGFAPEELVGRRFDALLAPGDDTRLVRLLADGGAYRGQEGEVIECSLVHRDGSIRQFEVLHSNLLDNDDVRGIVLNARDVTERKAIEERLAHQAFHDPITSLPNRALFVERVRHAIARARREGSGLAVVFLDLDDFKTVNDSLGHAAGDDMLVTAAKRLVEHMRAGDTAARFGGDEFGLLLEDIESVEEAADTTGRILAALGAAATIGGKELGIHCSAGISILDIAHPSDADELIRDADAAMHIAKREGKGDYQMFEPEMHQSVIDRLELRGDLQRALTDSELELFYQPLVRLADGSAAGVEALLRWRHPTRGLVAPGDFIPFAEESGLIVPIGRWVLQEACRQAIVIQREIVCDPPLTMSVNLSVKQLQDADIVEDVAQALRASGLAPELLMLEITETVLMSDTDLAVERLDELRALGVRLAMDDFGTGYSSLSYLNRFAVDALKMDRSFLREGATPEASGLTSAVVAIGESLRLDVVAEGIELREQWRSLRDMGCNRGQGFFFARPMPIADTLEALRTWSARVEDLADGSPQRSAAQR